jgi:hypothetical protein
MVASSALPGTATPDKGDHQLRYGTVPGASTRQAAAERLRSIAVRRESDVVHGDWIEIQSGSNAVQGDWIAVQREQWVFDGGTRPEAGRQERLLALPAGIRTLRNRSAFPMTETELRLIAALAIIGLRSRCRAG